MSRRAYIEGLSAEHYTERGAALSLTVGDVLSASTSGPADDAVAGLVNLGYISRQLDAIGADAIREELGHYGAWDADQLTDDAENRLRFVWLACGSLREEMLECGFLDWLNEE